MSTQPKYHRILLKLSGEALMGEADYGIDPNVIGRLAEEIIEVRRAGVEVGVVIGGGNIFQIGRASCRERVEVSVVAEVLKRKR